jgi:hypothetical protein
LLHARSYLRCEGLITSMLVFPSQRSSVRSSALYSFELDLRSSPQNHEIWVSDEEMNRMGTGPMGSLRIAELGSGDTRFRNTMQRKGILHLYPPPPTRLRTVVITLSACISQDHPPRSFHRQSLLSASTDNCAGHVSASLHGPGHDRMSFGWSITCLRRP